MNKTQENIEKFKRLLALYSQDLISTLNSANIEDYKNFIEKWYKERLIDDITYNAYKNGSETQIINSYCHLILSEKKGKVSDLAKKWAKKQLNKNKNIC